MSGESERNDWELSQDQLDPLNTQVEKETKRLGESKAEAKRQREEAAHWELGNN